LRCNTAWIWFFKPVRSRTNWARRDIRRRARRVGSSAGQISGKNPVPSNWAKLAASSRSVFALVAPMVLVTAALATATRATRGSIRRAIAKAFPVASSPTTSLDLNVRANATKSCRPPAAWDHFEVSFASSMGPPFRQ
jgi:hypothetical protein